MSGSDLQRVRRDLDAMQEVVGSRLPFGRAAVWWNVGLAAWGGALVVWTATVEPWQSVRVLVWVGLLGLAAFLLWRDHGRSSTDERPGQWREYRRELIMAAVIVPVVIGYLFWEKTLGLPRPFTGAAAVFFVGVMMLSWAVMDRRRLSYVGGAVPLMAFGATIPLCTAEQVVMAGGAAVAVGGLMMAAIQAWQLKGQGA